MARGPQLPVLHAQLRKLAAVGEATCLVYEPNMNLPGDALTRLGLMWCSVLAVRSPEALEGRGGCERVSALSHADYDLIQNHMPSVRLANPTFIHRYTIVMEKGVFHQALEGPK